LRVFRAASAKDIENQTNVSLNGLIYEDNNIEDDDIECKYGTSPISIENTNEKETESKLLLSKSSREIQDRNKNTRNSNFTKPRSLT
jgi:hypothetical protein